MRRSTDAVARVLYDARMTDQPARNEMSGRELFREAFRRWATTVVVVTYREDDGRPAGMTATSMSSLSAEPPSLLVCINRETRAHPMISRRGTFGIDMLSVSQRPIATHCSARGRDKILRDNWLGPDPRPDAPPRLAQSLAHLECRMDRSYEAFSHTIMVGVIEAVWINPLKAAPLLYHGGLYRPLESEGERDERFHWEVGE
jgi:flavin reductase (DIM6/NTAB) family NADH-FMN oxidoreductase RutF